MHIKTIHFDDKLTEFLKDKTNVSKYVRDLIIEDMEISNNKEDLEKSLNKIDKQMKNLLDKRNYTEEKLIRIYKDEILKKEEIQNKIKNMRNVIVDRFSDKFQLIKKSKFLIDLTGLKPKKSNDKELFKIVMKMRDQENIDVNGYDLYWYLVYYGYIDVDPLLKKDLLKNAKIK